MNLFSLLDVAPYLLAYVLLAPCCALVLARIVTDEGAESSGGRKPPTEMLAASEHPSAGRPFRGDGAAILPR